MISINVIETSRGPDDEEEDEEFETMRAQAAPSQTTSRTCRTCGYVGEEFYPAHRICKPCYRASVRCQPGVAAKCSRCGRVGFPPVDFYPSNSRRCKPCRKFIDDAHWESKSPEYWHQKQRDRHATKNYGITTADIERMTAAQGGRCAVCAADPKERFHSPKTQCLHVDHDHQTGRVRAMLCTACNKALGHFKDDPALLRKAASYLEKYR